MAGWEEERRIRRDGGVAGGVDAALGAGKRKKRWDKKKGLYFYCQKKDSI